jgi:hypothetical protein
MEEKTIMKNIILFFLGVVVVATISFVLGAYLQTSPVAVTADLSSIAKVIMMFVIWGLIIFSIVIKFIKINKSLSFVFVIIALIFCCLGFVW